MKFYMHTNSELKPLTFATLHFTLTFSLSFILILTFLNSNCALTVTETKALPKFTRDDALHIEIHGGKNIQNWQELKKGSPSPVKDKSDGSGKYDEVELKPRIKRQWYNFTTPSFSWRITTRSDYRRTFPTYAPIPKYTTRRWRTFPTYAPFPKYTPYYYRTPYYYGKMTTPYYLRRITIPTIPTWRWITTRKPELPSVRVGGTFGAVGGVIGAGVALMGLCLSCFGVHSRRARNRRNIQRRTPQVHISQYTGTPDVYVAAASRDAAMESALAPQPPQPPQPVQPAVRNRWDNGAPSAPPSTPPPDSMGAELPPSYDQATSNPQYSVTTDVQHSSGSGPVDTLLPTYHDYIRSSPHASTDHLNIGIAEQTTTSRMQDDGTVTRV